MHTVRKRGLATETDLGQLCRRRCGRVQWEIGSYLCTQQTARCGKERAADHETECTAAQDVCLHGDTFTDIRANTLAGLVCLITGISVACRTRRCAGNWRYTCQAYLARAAAHASSLSCEQEAL